MLSKIDASIHHLCSLFRESLVEHGVEKDKVSDILKTLNTKIRNEYRYIQRHFH